MPNIKSAIKRVQVAERNRRHNTSIKSAVKTAFRAAREAIDAGVADTLAKVRKAISAIDKAASKGIIHRNTAARKKSRLFKKYNASLTKAQAPTAAKPAKTAKKTKTPAASKPAVKKTAKETTKEKAPEAKK